MKKFRRILPIFLALVMCVTSILPVYATGAVTTTSTETTGSFSTTDGSVMFEAEDAVLNEALVTKKENTAASNGYVVEMTENEGYKSNTPTVDMVAGVSFNVVPDKSATYSVWLRISSNGSTDSAWCSVDGAVYTQVKPDVDASDSNTFGWKKIATVKATEGEEFNLRYRPREEKALWDKIVVTSDENFDPTSLSEYVIKFIDYDSTVLSSAVCLENEIINIPSEQTRSENEAYTYTFAGWKLYNTETNQVEGEYLASGATVTGDATYQAVYIATEKNTTTEYTIKFIDYDNTELSTAQYAAGTTIELPNNPTRTEDDDYTYTFAGWKLYNTETNQVEGEYLASGATVTGDATYQAVYIATEKNITTEYTIKFINYDNTELSTAQYAAGAEIVLPSTPTRAEDDDYTYTFAGWKLYNTETNQVEGEHLASGTTVTGNATYQAVYTATEKNIDTNNGIFTTTKGSVMFEAEDTRLNTDVSIVETTTVEGASGNYAVRMCKKQTTDASGATLKTLTYANNSSDLGFDVTVDEDGTYSVWARVAVYSKDYSKIFLSSEKGDYKDTTITTTYSTTPAFYWVRLATVEGKSSGDSVSIDIKPRQGNSTKGILFDAFVVTADATFQPTDEKPLPDVNTGDTPNIATFNTVDGSVMFEAESTSLNAEFVTVQSNEAASGKKVVEMTTSHKPDTNPAGDTESGINFNIIPDKDGTYYIWLRLVCNSNAKDSVWFSVDGADYSRLNNITGGVYSQDFVWIRLSSVEAESGKQLNLRFRAREKGALLDKFLITTNISYAPSGEGELPDSEALYVQPMPDTYDDVTIPVPPSKTHPRVMFTSDDIDTIKANLAHAENVEAYASFNTLKAKAYDGVLDITESFNYDGEGLSIIEAKAFDYAINHDDADEAIAKAAYNNGEAAVTAIKNYLETFRSTMESTNYRDAGQVILTAAKVYDWCYALMEETELDEITARCQVISADYLEIGFPPTAQSAVTGHGSEAQLMRDWMALAIATYDEHPEIYKFVAGRYYAEYVPAREYWYTSETQHQGSAYGYYRYTWDLWAQLLICNMSKEDDVNFVYGASDTALLESASNVAYQWVYTRRPDGELLREGDDTNERSTVASSWFSKTNPMFFYASNTYSDGVLKKLFLRDATFGYGSDSVTAVEMLVFNNPSIETKDLAELPLTKYFGSPVGAMVARTGWNMGVDSPDVLAYMKIGEVMVGNHQHRDAGNFQIYYKGILASESGAHMGYNNAHNNYYNASSIAHNTLSITSAENPTGVQRIPNKNGASDISTEYKTIEELKTDIEDCTTGIVVGQEFGPDNYAPEYSYIAGDIAAAYDDNVQNAVRSMLFLPLEDEEHPAAFVVFDRITTKEANSTKTFMLHMQSEPVINGNVTVITNTEDDYNGMLTNQTLLPANATITKIGGEGQQFMVGGENVEPSNRYSLTGMEEGWGRVEISTTASNAGQTDYFLNVMYVNDADKTLALEEAQLIEGDMVVGVKIFDRVAMFNTTLVDKESRIGEAITFTIPEDTDVISYKVNVAGLKAGTWTIKVNGSEVDTQVATDEGGIIYFTAPAGECTIIRTGDASEKTFSENKPSVVESIDVRVNMEYLYTPVKPEVSGEELYLPVKALLKFLILR